METLQISPLPFLRHAMKRKTFGKKLIEHQVIRYKLAEMARMVRRNTSGSWYTQLVISGGVTMD